MTKAPVAKQIDKTLQIHGDERNDPFYWLNQRESPEVIDYLKAENKFLKEEMAHTTALQEKLYGEIRGRIKEDDNSVPYKKGSYYYYHRNEQGREYPIFCRKKGSLEAEEEVLLNVNELAEGHSFFDIGGLAISSKEDYLAYSVDTTGRRIYELRFKSLTTGETDAQVIDKVTPNVCWANDNETVFFARQDPQTLRSEKIFRYNLSDQKETLVYQEMDETFSVHVHKTLSKKYLVISCSSTLTTESRVLLADDPMGKFNVFLERERSHEYHLCHGGNEFYVLTNWEAKNFRVMSAPENSGGRHEWEEVIAHREDVLVEDLHVFEKYIAIEEYKNGLTEIQLVDRSSRVARYLEFDEPVYTLAMSTNAQFDTETFRFNYESLTTPSSIYDFNVKTNERTLLKEKPILGGFERDNYTSERMFATAEDGTQVPVSIVYRKDVKKNGKAPTLLYGYGSYGLSMTPNFGIPRLSLLDRGFVFAIAHIRGGSEMGRKWYEQGKLFNKRNTFTDFISVAEKLIEAGFTNPQHLYAAGGSAGGLLMGAVINLRPDLFNGVLADVPFVDVVTTMLDDSIPLTTGEYDEWGNPNDKEYYQYMKSYSPYDNVEAKDYPNMMVLTGLHDSQVQYWEPAKWVAKLRAVKTDSNRLYLFTNLETGHGGASGRFEALKQVALEYSFLLDLEGIKE